MWICDTSRVSWTMHRSMSDRQSHEKDNTEEVFAAIADPEKYVVVQCTGSPPGLRKHLACRIGTDVRR